MIVVKKNVIIVTPVKINHPKDFYPIKKFVAPTPDQTVSLYDIQYDKNFSFYVRGE